MSCSVIYLENHKCKVCEAIERNVIEPVAVFVPEGEEENLKSELEELNSEQLEERLKEHYQNIKGKTKTKIFLYIHSHQTCIFHCEKENEIWMENYNDGYEEYTKRRNKAIEERKPFEEVFKIEWNEELIEEFWRRIRKYTKKHRIWDFYKVIFPRFELPSKIRNRQFKSLEADFWDDISQHSSTINITFDKAKFLDEVLFWNRIFDYLEFEKVQFYGNFNISNCKIFKRFYCNEVEFLSNVEIANSEFLEKNQNQNIVFFGKNIFMGNLKFLKNKFFGNLLFQKSFFIKGNFLLHETVFENKADFIGCKYKNTTKILGCKFENNFDLSESEFDKEAKFLVYGYYDNKENNVEIQNLIINSVYNYSETIRFYGVKVKNLLKITNTSLKNFDFNNLDLTEAKDIVFRNVSFDDCILNNIHWGEISENRVNIEEKLIPYISINSSLKKEKLIELRDVYRQLKLVLDKQEDHITANKFYALEMKAHEKYLKQQGWTKDNWQEKIVFVIHKVISNFGQSWSRPLSLIILLTIIMTGLSFIPDWKSLLITSTFSFAVSLIVLLILLPLTLKLKNGNVENFWILIFFLSVMFFINWLCLNLCSCSPDIKNLSKNKNLLSFLDDFAQTLNISKVFKTEQNNKHFAGYKFLYMLYLFVTSTLIYQFIVAVRRKVKR